LLTNSKVQSKMVDINARRVLDHTIKYLELVSIWRAPDPLVMTVGFGIPSICVSTEMP
jgi:hypothetical protein